MGWTPLRMGVLLPGLLLATMAAAQDLTPERAAQIQAEQDAAMKKIDQEHGHRKSSQMDNDERAQLIHEQQAARLQVLDKYGVSDKDYSRYVASMPVPDRQAEKKALKQLEPDQQGQGANTTPGPDSTHAPAAPQPSALPGDVPGATVVSQPPAPGPRRKHHRAERQRKRRRQ